MLRAALVAAALATLSPIAAAGQALGVLHIKVVLLDADRKATPVPRHALLISDNPSTSTPRRVVTTLDGTADVRLRPGNYTVESDAPVAFNGKAYEWTQIVDIVAGRDVVLELNAGNADTVPVTPSTAGVATAETDATFVAAQWQSSVITLWTPTAYASGFLIGDGLVAADQRSVGAATTVEVQLTPTLKLSGNVLVADQTRDVAVVRIDAAAAAPIRPIPLACTPATRPRAANGQKVVAIDAPLHQQKSTISGTVSRVAEHDIESDLVVATGSAGGPVFSTDGLVGIVSVGEDDGRRRASSHIVPIDDVCAVVASAQQKVNAAAPPSAAHLPVEPDRPFPMEALKQAVERRAGSLNPYQASSSQFDLAFITPVLTYGAQYQAEQRNRRERSTGARAALGDTTTARLLMDFGSWSEYVGDFPPVLLVRATPKLTEGFWTKVARGAAQTQGVAIPPVRRFTSGFTRMRAYCGDAEVAPIHPFTIERRVSETDTIEEGLYVFDPGALGPSCGVVKLVLYSAKEPAKADAVVIDPNVIQRIWNDFEPYRH